MENEGTLKFDSIRFYLNVCEPTDFNLKIKKNSISSNSDGGGRSGVYCAIDANMELAEEEDCFHVFGYLKKLRQSRKGLIENVVSGNLSFLFQLMMSWMD